jgi:hypothetical protein
MNTSGLAGNNFSTTTTNTNVGGNPEKVLNNTINYPNNKSPYSQY